MVNHKTFYDSLLYDLKYNAIYFYAVYQDKIIAMSIVLLANGYMNYHLSASDRVYQHLAPTNLLLYEAACWGCEHGFSTFHLGGGVGSRADDLYQFKSSFNRNSDYSFSIGKKIFNQPVYEELVEIRVKEYTKADENLNRDVSTTFFPQYRGIY
jgi:lipid II:glycine glycyltransferase (peptidoglycan interpeptide bridge formation enzyme)